MSSYTPRLTAPTKDNVCYYADNPFEWSGYGLPNCTAYAWGRFYEILGSKPKLSLGNAEEWYLYSDGYSRGSIPKLGAVACWRKGVAGDNSDGAGHVAIVEIIHEDGSITTSESGWGASSIFWTTKRANNGNWGASSAYTFQGFIYNPTAGATVLPNLKWIAKNTYLTEKEMQNNAKIIYRYLLPKGWTLEAIAALIANFEHESTVSPARWQIGFKPGNMAAGYGLAQWTPATKLKNWAGSDWETNHNKQLDFLQYHLEHPSEHWVKRAPYNNWTITQFAASTADPYMLACVFCWNYEGNDVVLNGTYAEKEDLKLERGSAATKWYNYLKTVSVPTATNIPLWLLFKLKERYS